MSSLLSRCCRQISQTNLTSMVSTSTSSLSVLSPLSSSSSLLVLGNVFEEQRRGYKPGSQKYRKELAKRRAMKMFEATLRREGKERSHQRKVLAIARKRNNYQNYLWDLKNNFSESWEELGPPKSWRPLKEHNLIMYKGGEAWDKD